MPDFTSNIQVSHPDQIGPAINELAGNMMKMTQFKAAEQEKRDAKLAELASLSLGQVFDKDNADLQSEKTNYINEVVKASAKNRGRIPWQEQAELMAKKQALAQKAAVSVQHREEYADVIKKMAIDPNIDPEETGKALLAWRNTPLSERGSAWSVVQPRVSLQEYFGKNIKLNISKDRYMKGNELRETEKFNSLPQMMAIISENRPMQNKAEKEMQQAGIPRPANGYKAEQIGSYLQKTYGPMFDKDVDRLVRVEKPSGGGGVTIVTPQSTTPTPSTRKVTSVFGGNKINYDISFQDDKATPGQPVVSFPGGGYIDASAYNGPKNDVVSPDLKVNSIKMTPVTYIESTKDPKKSGWYLVSDEQLKSNPNMAVEYKPYIWGTHTETEYGADGKVARSTDREYAVPATPQNVAAVRGKLTQKAAASWNVEPGDFSKPTGTSAPATGKTYTMAQAKASYPGKSESDIRAFLAANGYTEIK